MKVREGDSVQAGQLLARLEDTQLAARKQQADAAVATVQAQLDAARAQLAIARREVPLAEASAGALLAKARAAEAQAAKDARRFDELAARGTVETRRAEQMRLAHTAAAADLRQAEQSVSSAHLGNDKVKARENDIAALAAGLRQAQAAASEVAGLIDDLNLRAPTGGVVLNRLRENGEMVAAGTPVFDLVDLDKLYLKVVPEKQIGQLRLGLPAQVHRRLPGQAFPPAPATSPPAPSSPQGSADTGRAGQADLRGEALLRQQPRAPAEPRRAGRCGDPLEGRGALAGAPLVGPWTPRPSASKASPSATASAWRPTG
jgi:HlyD family secretion protein